VKHLEKHFNLFSSYSKEQISSSISLNDFHNIVLNNLSKTELMILILEKQINEFNIFLDLLQLHLSEDNSFSFLSSSNKISIQRDIDRLIISFFGTNNIYDNSYYNERELFFTSFNDFFNNNPNIKNQFSIFVETSNRRISIDFKPKIFID